ncbi:MULTISPECIES: TetR/AcrR family transcriptional regulator [unclassified Streptomyces]|uniref:TetR/AcrR family transcriptional regulator n=1 Tax=unclassified Streptomyces TaxID=2593676 RepID=UPI000DD6022E|nr:MULTISPECIES: TetR/AcrR family transcriptional regulator [unclassified Streptomyces]QZZ26433.1 TetR/AcrR family transcriptional regulator [Streptomyces sp. ST1015]
MARVSQAHLDARRRQIIDAAERCFARNGFHATSMQDVLKEADLSAGAVYRYFSGKDELIAAIVGEVIGVLADVYGRAAEESPAPLPDELVPRVMRSVLEARAGRLEGGEWLFPRLLVQAWSEILRNEELARQVRGGYERVHESWQRVVRSYKDAGIMPPEADADALARAMIAMAQGLVTQIAVLGATPEDMEKALTEGVRALMSMRDPRSEGSRLG